MAQCDAGSVAAGRRYRKTGSVFALILVWMVAGCALDGIKMDGLFGPTEHTDLDAMAADVAVWVDGELMARNGENGSRAIHMDRQSMVDAVTHRPRTLTRDLQTALEKALRHTKLDLVSADASQAVGVLRANYLPEGEKVRFTVWVDFRQTASGADEEEKARKRERSWLVPVTGLAPGVLEEGLETVALDLAAALTKNITGRRIHVETIVEQRYRFASPYSRRLTHLLHGALERQGNKNRLVPEGPLVRRVANSRALIQAAERIRALPVMDASLVGADVTLSGTYSIRQGEVLLVLRLLDSAGKTLSQVEHRTPYDPDDGVADHPKARRLAMLADDYAQGATTRIRIGATRGGVHPLYLRGERVRFLLKGQEPLHILLYSMDSHGSVTPLLPIRGSRPALLDPRLIRAVPGDTDGWAIEAAPPFGIDVIKVFASPKPITPPKFDPSRPSLAFTADGARRLPNRPKIQAKLAGQRTIHPLDLVDWFRGRAKRQRVALYEESLLLETMESDSLHP
ncbi:MAG: DUF4384 domain-containing protein [Magnetococcales bacterium]|nr:DUF4384 domain-containing protein [Magnetococcales bacterium]